MRVLLPGAAGQRELGRRASERKYSSIWVRNPAGTSSEPESESGWSSPCAFFRRFELEILQFLDAFAGALRGSADRRTPDRVEIPH